MKWRGSLDQEREIFTIIPGYATGNGRLFLDGAQEHLTEGTKESLATVPCIWAA